MLVCPNRETLRRLLEGQLPEDQRTSLEGHIEACSRCQRILDQITNSALPSELDEALHRSAQSEPRKPSIPDIELLEVIGRGSSGQVWKGQLLENQQLVAVKVILGGNDSSPEHLVRFQREIEILARLNNPNLIRLFHAGPFSEGYFFSMEYVPAKSILDVRAREAAKRETAKWSVQQIAAMVRDVAQAIQHAHENQVLHLDLKPGNILLAEGSIPKVADFSLGKLLDGSTRTTVGPAGTPCYMAPEQVRGEAATVRTDVYGIGALLYDWLTGQPPIAASENHSGTMQRVLVEWPVSIRSLRPDVPVDLVQITVKCLQKIPTDRYASAKEVAEDLQRFLDQRPVLARPLSRPRQAIRWAKRNPANAVLLLLLILSVQTGLGVTTILWRRAEARAEEAQTATRAAITSRNAAREMVLLYSVKVERLYRTDMGITTEDRKALTHAATRTLEQLEADGDDPELEWKVAWSVLKIAEAMQNLGEFESGERLVAKVVAVLRRLTVNTEDRRKLHDLAQAEADHANLLFQVGRHEEGVALSRVAEERVVELFEKYPHLYGFQITLASMRWHQGQRFHILGRYPEALRCYEASLVDLRGLLRRLPTNAERLGEFQVVCRLYAETLFLDHTRRNHALAILQESANEFERFRQTAPKDEFKHLSNFSIYPFISTIQNRMGKLNDAIATMKRQLDLTREYHRVNPDTPNASLWHVAALAYLGEFEWASRPESASQRFRDALKILDEEIQRRPTKEASMAACVILTQCPDPTIRNPKLALEYARQAERFDPQDVRSRLCLMCAMVHNQQYAEALAIPEVPLPQGLVGWKSDMIYYSLALIEARFRTGKVQTAQEQLTVLAKVIDREIFIDLNHLQQFDRLQKLILGIDPPPLGTPR